MKFPLTMDLRKATLAEGLPGQVIMDADQRRIMLVYPDANGRHADAELIVDLLNLADRYGKLAAMEQRLRAGVVA